MKCRHCQTELHDTFIDLGFSPPSNAYLKAEDLRRPETTYPLKVMVCRQCWLVQTEDYTHYDQLFATDYAYFSSTSTTWLQHAERYVDMIAARLSLGAQSLVVELAANDGYLLQYVQRKGIPCLGVEPTTSTADAARAKGIKVYAARNGILGALREELIDTSKESKSAIAALRHTPGGAFGSCRYKLKSLDANRAEYERLIQVFRAHDIRWFLYNGGNDSADTALKISQLGKAMNYDIRCIGVPKTVDNDLAVTDCCPGFGSVAKYIAISTREASLDVASMAETSTKVFILEVMGRHAGWIAAAAGLAGIVGDAGKILVLDRETVAALADQFGLFILGAP